MEKIVSGIFDFFFGWKFKILSRMINNYTYLFIIKYVYRTGLKWYSRKTKYLQHLKNCKNLKKPQIKTIKLKIPIFAKNILRGLNQEKNNSES